MHFGGNIVILPGCTTLPNKCVIVDILDLSQEVHLPAQIQFLLSLRRIQHAPEFTHHHTSGWAMFSCVRTVSTTRLRPHGQGPGSLPLLRAQC